MNIEKRNVQIAALSQNNEEKNKQKIKRQRHHPKRQ